MGFPSVVRHEVDAEAKVVLRAASEGAETTTAAEAAVPLNTLQTAYWHNKEVPQQTFAAIFRVTAGNFGGSRTYELQLQVDTDQAFAGGDSEVVASLPVNATGYYVINLDGPTIKKILDGAAFLRSAVVISTDGAETIDYEAWLAPAKSQG